MTEERPVLDKTLNSKTFQEFYYTKKELLDFCRENHISTSGGKLELAERIISFLDTGYVPKLASTANRKTHNSQPQVIKSFFNAILNIIFNFILTFHSNHINIVGNKKDIIFNCIYQITLF